MTLTSTSLGGGGALYLSIEAGIDKYRLAVLDEKLEVVWTEQVILDVELPEYKTRNGVHTLGDRVTAPSEMRLKALDLLLEKLSVNTRQAQLIPRIVAITGSGQPGVLHFLNPQFESLLAILDNSSSRRISEIVNSSTAFTLEEPASSGDSSTMTQVRKLETHFGKLSLSSSSSPISSSSSLSVSTRATSSASSSILTVQQHFQILEKGREYFALKTGSKVLPHYSAAQLVKIREKDDESLENGEIPSRKAGVLGRTGRIVTESSLLSSVFVGKLVPIDASDASSTNLFNPVEGDWEDEILDFVITDTASRVYENSKEDCREKARLRELFGEVQKDGTISIGTVSFYLVNRFGFSSSALVVSFINTDAATFLSFPLHTTSASDPFDQRDAFLSLTSSETDSLFIPSPHFAPHPDRQFFLHPAQPQSVVNEEGGGGGGSRYVAMITSKDAGLARSLSRDLYCNGSWDVFTRLVAIVPHGGTLGLDGKQFSIFFPHGQASFVQGFLRFVGGVKVPELPDRKSNPRLMVESQFLSLRIRLSRLYSSLLSLTPHSIPHSSTVSPHDPLGFPKLSSEFLPTRIVLVGSASINPAMTSVLSTILGAPAYLSRATGLKRSTVEGEDLEEYCRGKEKSSKERKKTSAAALGAGYRAAWVWERKNEGIEEVGSYESFLEKKLEAQAIVEAEGGGIDPIESQAHSLPTQRIDDDPLEEEKYPISSVASQLPSIPVTERSQQRRSSSIYTLASSSAQTHSRKSSIYSSATSLFSSAPLPPPTLDDEKSMSNGDGRSGGGGKVSIVKQKMYNPEHDDFLPVKSLGEDPAGLDLVALPDEPEFKYYASMMPEYVRLEKYALKGLI
ncbi:hypothetical protein JCM3765_006442 [Sporobolomyces pararoseus]